MLYEVTLGVLLVWRSTKRHATPRSQCPVLKRFPQRQQQRGDRVIYVSAEVEGYSLAM